MYLTLFTPKGTPKYDMRTQSIEHSIASNDSGPLYKDTGTTRNNRN